MSEEYVSRSAALTAIFARICRYPIDSSIRPAYEDALEAIGRLPVAEVMPVVQCKNCKWFADNNHGEWYGCKMFQVVRITPEDAPKPDDFCSYGERKEGAAHAAD